ncbi:CoA transferase [Streptomyces sp. NPDC050625]|uniref:CaiB/BaiF CoA transferase family protein n=1 Tax=Streptomyces sp. NPDC050625 TaxID=3154629 RepID=UPI00343F49D8
MIMTSPLNTRSMTGLRVLEIGTSVAGPFATQILGDLGAEVIKIERVTGGDDTRSWAPPAWNDESVAFLSFNRNKKSLALDFKTPSGRKILERLVGTVDVLVQNLRPGALAASGFSAGRLRQLNPRLIYCEMTGFGGRGPRGNQPAYDPLLQAYAGIVSITGEEGGAPVRVPVSILDMGTAMWSVIAVQDALSQRDRTGVGCHIETSLLQTAVSWLASSLVGVLAGGSSPSRLGSGVAGVVPYGAFPTSDGHVFISAGNDAAWGRLCDALDADDLRQDGTYATNPLRAQRRERVNADVARRTRRYTIKELLARLEAHQVPCAPVRDIAEVAQDEQVLELGQLQDLPHAAIPDLRVINTPATFDGAYPPHQSAPPALGEHSAHVLRSVGATEEDIARLIADGVVTQPAHQPALADGRDLDPLPSSGHPPSTGRPLI